MDEFISKHEAYKMLKDKQAAYMQVAVNEAFGTAARIIDQMKPADVQPVKRGRWELTDNPSFRKCSECGAWWSSDITDNCFTNYCPKCGAKMDGDAE